MSSHFQVAYFAQEFMASFAQERWSTFAGISIPTTPYKNPGWIDQIMSFANEASFIKYFLRRVLQDFPTHKNILLLLKAKYLFGLFGMDILTLMKYIFSGSIESLKALWKCAKHLHDSQDLTEKIFMDHPTRVYQEATSIMVWKNIGDLAEQLYYYEIIKANLDAVTTTELGEENGLVEIFVPDMAYQECQAIHCMLETYKVLSRLKEVNELINRLEGLNDMFTDPRIRYVAFLCYKLVYIDTPKIFDDKIRELVSLVYATPPQIPSMDVNLEKSYIMNEIFFYFLKARRDEETAKKYYQEFSADVVKPSFHRPSVEAIEQYAHTAANAIEYHLANGNRTSCIWYFDNIKAINKYLESNSSGILQIMISELGDKLFNNGKDGSVPSDL
jgi:hypothetical protein